jgi:hypothetical protein
MEQLSAVLNSLSTARKRGSLQSFADHGVGQELVADCQVSLGAGWCAVIQREFDVVQPTAECAALAAGAQGSAGDQRSGPKVRVEPLVMPLQASKPAPSAGGRDGRRLAG